MQAAALAAQCGHSECARYLEEACLRQQSDAKGIFEQSHAGSDIQPSVHDVTAGDGMSVVVCSEQFASGVTNGHSQIVAPSDDTECAMDEDDGSQQITVPFNPVMTLNTHSMESTDKQSNNGGIHNGDVTLHRGVSQNYVPVAGRKRTREETDPVENKRVRSHGGYGGAVSGR